MVNMCHIAAETPPLQEWAWPPVAAHTEFDPEFRIFAELATPQQRDYLAALRATPDRHAQVLHDFLGVVSGYFFGYQDSPLYMATDDDLEIAIQRAKIVLEREACDIWLAPPPPEHAANVEKTIDRLKAIASDSPSKSHPLFAYLRDHASAEAMRVFLWNEVIRNEVVDDEVAMLSVGTQGIMKVSAGSNLWDELGHGRLRNFHTYWLRRLITGLGTLEDFMRYRSSVRPWFTKITTNIFNILLSRPGLKFHKYGWFLTNESWVESHFLDIVAGMNRLGFMSDDIQIYFTAHIAIDPAHTSELLDGIRLQVPALNVHELNNIVAGAHMAVAAAKAQYDHVHAYLREMDVMETYA